jgi:hypothetical protein
MLKTLRGSLRSGALIIVENCQCTVRIILYSTVQYSTVQYSTVQYSTVYSTVQYTVPYSTVSGMAGAVQVQVTSTQVCGRSGVDTHCE